MTATPATRTERKLLYRITEAAQILSYSRTLIYELMRSGQLRSVGSGKTRRIPASAIAEYIAQLEKEAAG